jgi:carbonic anhydrase
MRHLIEGLKTFQNEVFPRHRELFERLYGNQAPACLFITCSDSRVVPNLILQAEPGELFVLRNAGNIVPPPGTGVGGTISGIEYAVEVLGVRGIVLCGHSNCGAMKGILHPEAVAHLPNVSSWVRHGEPAREAVERLFPGIDEARKLDRLVEQNVILQVKNLLAHDCVRRAVDERRLELYGWVYDILTGHVRGINEAGDAFVDLHPDAPGSPDERKMLLDLETPSGS